MPIYARSLPYPEPRRKDHKICTRCGIGFVVNYSRTPHHTTCMDCHNII